METIRKLSETPSPDDSSNDAFILVGKQQLEVNLERKQSLLESSRFMQEDLDETTAVLHQMRRTHNGGYAFMTRNEEKQHIQQYRAKASRYKELCAEIRALQAEQQNLTTTKFALDSELLEQERNLCETEKSLGLQGISDIQDNLEATSDMKV